MFFFKLKSCLLLVPLCSRKKPKPPRRQKKRKKILEKVKVKARGKARLKNDWRKTKGPALPLTAPTDCKIFTALMNRL